MSGIARGFRYATSLNCTIEIPPSLTVYTRKPGEHTVEIETWSDWLRDYWKGPSVQADT